MGKFSKDAILKVIVIAAPILTVASAAVGLVADRHNREVMKGEVIKEVLEQISSK